MPDPGEMPRTLESIGYFQESLMTARQYMVTIDASDKNVAKNRKYNKEANPNRSRKNVTSLFGLQRNVLSMAVYISGITDTNILINERLLH